MFALVDCNNSYASCQRVFNPAITHRPVIVLSSNDGCVIARSNEAMALGFNLGDPYFKVRPLIEKDGVADFSSNYTLHGDMSRRVMQTLEQFSPEVEIYSIDEAFLNVAGFLWMSWPTPIEPEPSPPVYFSNYKFWRRPRIFRRQKKNAARDEGLRYELYSGSLQYSAWSIRRARSCRVV
jgi:nucleotidyltransferase/DNA polymerase involved in DNA repair